MSNTTIASIHRYSNRFLRSTDLSRDFNDPNGLQGYCLTDFALSCLSRLTDGLKLGSGHRAWRLTGDFGSGKSSFALLLANALRDTDKRLPAELGEQIFGRLPDVKQSRYVPVLVAGTREPMAIAILRSIEKALVELSPHGTKSSLQLSIEKALRDKRVSDLETLQLIQEANDDFIRVRKAQGTLLILDEVGKFLEYAALNPEENDIYLLQQLAEMANRSGKSPLLVVCLLHQGFNAYAEQLAAATQREWEKIAGRFDEILFQQPLDQVALLVSSAINPETNRIPAPLIIEAGKCLSKAIEIGWYGTSASREMLHRLQDRFFPLDPMLLPVLVRTFQRFGQNERSLFSFICSYEPFGLRAFSNGTLSEHTHPYRLADFYNYVRANLGRRLNVMSYRTHWNVIDSVVEALNTDDEQELRILKTIGILNLLGADDLKPTEEAICWAVGGNVERTRSKTRALLKKLVASRVLHFRGEARGYSLWPYTSVDIDSRLDDAKRAIPTVVQVANAISDELESKPIVARAHYIDTGNLRYFDVVYCKPTDLADQAGNYQTAADGFILVPLCETTAESRAAKAAAKEIGPRSDLIRLIAVPRSLHHLSQAALDAMRWEWVRSNTPELNSDRFAQEEVQIHLQEARNRLQNQVQDYIGLNRISNSSSLTWFYFGSDGEQRTQTFRSGRQVLRLLSTLCNEIYSDAPRIKNELVNRQVPSPAAVAARIRLIELMFTNAGKPDLGLPPDRKPPEKSMYLSVLKATKLHDVRDGQWRIALPNPEVDIARMLPALTKIKEIIASQPDTRVPVRKLMATLRKPPYGVRSGLFPLLLAVVAVESEQEIAFYENGTFLQEVNKDVFQRMNRASERFDIQYCKIEGVRSELFQQLALVLEVARADNRDAKLLDIVRNLCQFIARQPEYVRMTKRLTPLTLKVRDVVLEARDPVSLIFHDLPAACDFAQFEIDRPVSSEEAKQFVVRLKAALDELRSAFPNLLSRIEIRLANDFGYEQQLVGQYRHNLARRAEQLLVWATENKLKSFAFRLFDETLPESDWLKSVGSVLSLRPPDKWKDEDEDTFTRELENLAGRFKRAEAVAFGVGNNENATTGLRVAITQADGTERQEVIHLEAKDDHLLMQIQDEIAAVIQRNERLGIAAASRAIWARLRPIEESND